MARNLRQQKILELIAHESIGTQEDLAARLNAEGFAVTQATVSRDIKELGLIKTSADGKKITTPARKAKARSFRALPKCSGIRLFRPIARTISLWLKCLPEAAT